MRFPVELVHEHGAPLLGRRLEEADDEHEQDGVRGGRREGHSGADHLSTAAALCVQVDWLLF